MDPEKSAMQKHHSKIELTPQLELFDSFEYGPAQSRSWLILDPGGKPDRRAMETLHDKAREDEKYNDQRELARYLSGTPHQKLDFLLSDFEATLALDGLWGGTRVIMASLDNFSANHDLRYTLHYLHMEMDNLGVAAYWLKEAIRVEGLIKPKRKRKGNGSKKKKGNGKIPSLIDRRPPRSINYFFYACPFTWGEENLDDDEWDDDYM
jgi:hypothetical protein